MRKTGDGIDEGAKRERTIWERLNWEILVGASSGKKKIKSMTVYSKW